MKTLLTVLFNLLLVSTVFSQKINSNVVIRTTSDSLHLEENDRVQKVLEFEGQHYVIAVRDIRYPNTLKKFTIYRYNENWEFVNSSIIKFKDMNVDKSEFFMQFQVLDNQLSLFTTLYDKKDTLRVFAYNIDPISLKIGRKLNFINIHHLAWNKKIQKHSYITYQFNNSFYSTRQFDLYTNGVYLFSQYNQINEDGEYQNEISIFNDQLQLIKHYQKGQFNSNQIVQQVQYFDDDELLGLYITALKSDEQKRGENRIILAQADINYMNAKIFRIQNGAQDVLPLKKEGEKINNIKYFRLKNGNVRVITITRDTEKNVYLNSILIDEQKFEIVSTNTFLLDRDKIRYSPEISENPEIGINPETREYNTEILKIANYSIGDITINEDGSFYFIAEQNLKKTAITYDIKTSMKYYPPGAKAAKDFGSLIVARVNSNGEFNSVNYIYRFTTLRFISGSDLYVKANFSFINDDNSIQVFAQTSLSEMALYSCTENNEIEKINQWEMGELILTKETKVENNTVNMMNMKLSNYNHTQTYTFFTLNFDF